MTQEEMMRGQGYLTAVEVGLRIGLTPTSVYRMIERLGVRTQRAGSRVYVDAHALAAQLKEAPIIRAALVKDIPVAAPDVVEKPSKPMKPAKRARAGR